MRRNCITGDRSTDQKENEEVSKTSLPSTKPKVVLILQARMGSTRLLGKSMMDLAGAPLVGRIIERVKRCKGIDEIVLATTQKSEDDLLEELARSYGIFVFRGSENDLVDRYYQAAKAFDADIVVRLPADNPVPEPSEIDRIIAYHLIGESDFSSNLAEVYGNGYPDGIGAEVFNFEILEEVWRTSSDPHKREHLHLNFFDYTSQKPAAPDRYRVGTVQCPPEFRRPDLVLDVNTREEYEFMVELYKYLYPRNPQFHITDIIQWYDDVYRKNEVADNCSSGGIKVRTMIYCFDIDGTLCTNTEGDYGQAEPFYKVIAQVNRIYDEGHRILLYTARGSTTGIDWYQLTLEQLKKWNVHYHELFMGKPTADVYIDDKAMNSTDWKRRGFQVNLLELPNSRREENNE